MRLQAAIPIDELEGHDPLDDFAGFEGPEERAERRARRKKRRTERRTRRGQRKLRRLRRKTAKVREKTGLPRKAQRPASRKPARRTAPAATPYQDQGWQEPTLEPAPMDWTDPMDDPGVIDAEWSEVEPGLPEDEDWDEGWDEELEGIGAFRPVRALGQGMRAASQKVRTRAQAARSRAQARRATRQAGGAGWGPNVRMGRFLRIQAALGHRAAVIDLKPGLFLVAEIPEAVSRTEFGIAPLLAPLMIRAAKKAIERPQDGQPRQGPLSALFRHHQRQDGRPLRLFRAREAQAPALPGPSAPKALPGPVAAPALQPAAGSGGGRTFLLPAPNVGWADEHDVAELLGCEPCEGAWR